MLFDSGSGARPSVESTPTALALYLAESHLNGLLPQSVLDQLGAQFRKARNYLDDLGHNGLAHWARRVRTLPNGKALLPAQVDAQVWAQVCAALLESRQLEIDYLSRSKAERKQLRIHPAGLVSRHSTSRGYVSSTFSSGNMRCTISPQWARKLMSARV